MDIIDSIKNPAAKYRPVPFWSFNDKLEPEVLRTQIREMHKAGIGGYFMHARGGLKTEYMGSDWMNCIRACIDEGQRLGMNSWCYDENGWPSGFADGAVPALGEDFHVKWLVVEEITGADCHIAENDPYTLGIYGYNVDTGHARRVCSACSEDSFPQYFRIQYRTNSCYVDILNKDTIKVFIDLAYEKYYQQFGDCFGDGIMGFFTDEPQFSRDQIPWSHILPDEFLTRYNYDLSSHMLSLFVECEGYEKVRYDFWSLVSELYVTSFGKQIFDWCQQHNCKLTGHVMMEDSLLAQMYATAGAMPFYEYMHIPGMDWLCRGIDSPVIPKQVSSVAQQLGKEQVISETFALCGWDVNFEELKWIAEWQYVNGVNLMCQHLEGYSLKGFRKRDYPPSLFYQQTWWDEYRHFNDYFARLGMLLTRGESVVKVLLLHPIKSGWITYNHTDNTEISALDRDFRDATEMLSGLHIDHHYGDETIMRRHGRVDGSSLIVGRCKYSAVILPSLRTLDSSTVELLAGFIDNGGTVVSIGVFPELVEGVKDDRLVQLREKVLHPSKEDIYNILSKHNIPSIRLSDATGEIREIHCCERLIDGKRLFFAVNHSKEMLTADVRIAGRGVVRKLAVETTEYADITQTSDEDGIGFQLIFEPMQSHLLILEPDTDCTENPAIPAINGIQAVETIELPAQWKIEKMDMNSLTLDYCSYSIDGGPWEGPIHTINLMDLLLDRRKECDIALKFEFDVETDLNHLHQMYLAIEDAEQFDISVNGTPVSYRELGWWKDISFKKVDIREFVLPGKNTVLLKRGFYQSPHVYDVLFGENVLETELNKLTYDVELESIYLIGDFGVYSKSGYSGGERKALFTDGPFVVSDRPETLEQGCFTQQGLCFFAGRLTVSRKFTPGPGDKRYVIDLGRPDAAMCQAAVNGTPVKTVLWAPYTVDVTDFLTAGENEISITLYASNRNLLGPHHNIVGESYAVGPGTFTAKPGWSDDGKQENPWTDTYGFVRFGL